MNSAASVRARLLNLSKQTGEDFQALLNRYAIERFLYRLGASDQAEEFILKGAMLFVAWQGNLHRPTKDLDLLGFGDSAPGAVAQRIRSVASVWADDGIQFDPSTVEAEVIREDAEYEGVRVKLTASLDQACIRMQIDIGFGDAVDPAPVESVFPAILNHIDPPKLRMYPPEAVIAEKLQAMVVLDIRNSRMKDFYDLWYFARTASFDLGVLRRAVIATFKRRRTPMPFGLPFALTPDFHTDEGKQQQWLAFVRRLNLPADTPDLPQVGQEIARFIQPVFKPGGEEMRWQSGGPWRS
jgi:predicted nucleotidyltransferase component of viral defense system